MSTRWLYAGCPSLSFKFSMLASPNSIVRIWNIWEPKAQIYGNLYARKVFRNSAKRVQLRILNLDLGLQKWFRSLLWPQGKLYIKNRYLFNPPFTYNKKIVLIFLLFKEKIRRIARCVQRHKSNSFNSEHSTQYTSNTKRTKSNTKSICCYVWLLRKINKNAEDIT